MDDRRQSPDAPPAPRRAIAPPWASGERSSRANNFDAIRLALALGVIVAHAWPVVRGRRWPPEGGEPFYRWTSGQVTLGGLCVHAFFVISGYLIATSWVHSRSTADYFWKRVLRIYPGYLLATAVSLGVAAWAGAEFRFTAADALLRIVNTLLLHDIRVTTAFVHDPLPMTVNGSVWTIFYEFACYVLIAAAGGLIVHRRGATIAVAVIGLAAMAAVITGTGFSSSMGTVGKFVGVPEEWPRLLSHFLAGTAFYVYRDRIPHRGTLAIASVLAVLIGGRVSPGLMAVSPIALTYLVLWLAYHPRLRLHHAGRFGDFSYGAYLYAFPVQMALVHAGIATTVPSNIAWAIPMALACGVMSWHGCEKWFIHYRRSGRRPDELTTAQ